MKNIGVLGCTGSIGQTTLKVIANDGNLRAVLLVNYSNLAQLKKLINIFKPKVAACISANYLYIDGRETTLSTDILSDIDTYRDCDIVVNGIVGLAGLKPSLAVLKANKILATANKESFVCAGKLINEVKNNYNGKIYPLDSEHSAVWQLTDGRKDFTKIIITASGGAFRDRTREELFHSKAEEALRHPNWVMGKKVTIDCATLMNKGMEIIEARHLFGQKAEVLGHRESFVHALVQYADGTYNANLSTPDMTVPISYALNYPFVKKTDISILSLFDKNLHFFQPDESLFPCLKIGKEVADKGDKAGCIMNAADEVLVNRYLQGEVGFYDISDGVKKALDRFDTEGDFSDIDEVFRMDAAVREYTLSMCFGGSV